EVGAAADPGPDLGSVGEHLVLHVDLFFLVAGPGEVEAMHLPLGDIVVPLFLVEIVGGVLLVAEEYPVATGGAGGDAVLHKGAEGGDAGARADHDAVLGAVLGGAEVGVGNEDRHGGVAHLHAVGEEGRADAGALDAVGLVAHDGDGEMDFLRINLRGGR